MNKLIFTPSLLRHIAVSPCWWRCSPPAVAACFRKRSPRRRSMPSTACATRILRRHRQPLPVQRRRCWSIRRVLRPASTADTSSTCASLTSSSTLRTANASTRPHACSRRSWWALANTGAFRAVGSATSGIAGELRLDSEVLRLQQEFGGGPNCVRFTLRASLTDNATRRVISSREFEPTVVADSDDPYGGVVAANRAVQRVVQQLASYWSEVSVRWPTER